MSAIQEYLDRHFVEASRIAENRGMPVEELERLVDTGAVPAPSYVVLSDRIVSAAFGDLTNDGARIGRYFAPSQEQWLERVSAGDSLEVTFKAEMALELAAANHAIHRLRDAFDDDGKALSGLEVRIDAMWGYFLAGVFALCVADSGSVRSIARKEVLQEKLSELANGGAPLDRDELGPLIDAYDLAAMPFSPAEYPRSSRKRLVEDLRDRLTLVG